MMIGASLAEALGFRWEKQRRLNLGPHSNLKSLPSSVKDIFTREITDAHLFELGFSRGRSAPRPTGARRRRAAKPISRRGAR